MNENSKPAANTGLRALNEENFSFMTTVGGIRGIVESIAPGLLFVVLYLAFGQSLLPAVIGAASASLVAVVVRLLQRTSLTQAFSGVVGVAIGVIWALTSGRAENYFAWGLWTNVVYLLGTLISVLVGWPVVGLLTGLFAADGPLGGGPWGAVGEFRKHRRLRRRAAVATWIWVGLFAARLAVQVPLYLAAEVAWLGTAKLIMGVPLFAVAVWISWILMRPASAAAPSHQH